MADEVTKDPAQTQENGSTEEQSVPYERFKAVNEKVKAQTDRATALESQLAELRATIEERDAANLPELERERKRVEKLEERAAAAEKRAEETEKASLRTSRERIITSVAAQLGIEDPDDALRFPEHVNWEQIEDRDDAEKAIKRLVKAKPKLLKDNDPKPPQIGQVLKGGKETSPADSLAAARTAEATMIAGELAKFRARRDAA